MQSTCTSKVLEDPCIIEEGLYLGSVQAANNKIALKSMNVTHVLTVANNLPPAFPNEFVYKIISVPDIEHVNIAKYFCECYAFIEEAKRNGGGVLVHCVAGVSRSATIVLAYLMIKHGMSYDEAVNHVKKKRPVISPNIGFRMQLEYLEKSHRDRWVKVTFRISLTWRLFKEAIRSRKRY